MLTPLFGQLLAHANRQIRVNINTETLSGRHRSQHAPWVVWDRVWPSTARVGLVFTPTDSVFTPYWAYLTNKESALAKQAGSAARRRTRASLDVDVRPERDTAWRGRKNRARAWRESVFAVAPPEHAEKAPRGGSHQTAQRAREKRPPLLLPRQDSAQQWCRRSWSPRPARTHRHCTCRPSAQAAKQASRTAHAVST